MMFFNNSDSEKKSLKRIVFLTGRPGIGKTTVLIRIVEKLRINIDVGGMVSQEFRQDGARVGFRIMDLENGKEGWLARIGQPEGPKVGRYRVCFGDLESIGARAILSARSNSDVIVIDEVGPMELSSIAFKEAVREALNSGKTVLGTIHYRACDSLITEIVNREDVTMIEVTSENREKLPQIVVQEVSKRLSTA